MAILRYQGHASFKLVDNNGLVIYIDPFQNVGFDARADLILITHEHFDHTQTQLVPVKATTEILRAADMHPDDEYLSLDINSTIITAVPAYNSNHNVDECVGYVIEADGVRVYFAGDTSTTTCMSSNLANMNLDYAFLPCDGVFNMNYIEASECAKIIGAKHTVPIHTAPTSSPDECKFDFEVAEAFDCPGKLVLFPGDELEL